MQFDAPGSAASAVVVDVDDSPATARVPRRLRVRRLGVAARGAAPVCYLGLAGAVFATHGIPLSRDWLFVWILGGLFCLSLGSLSRFARSLLTEWLPLAAALTLYDVLRGIGGGRFPIHGELEIRLDRWVFGFGHLPTIWLQQHLWNPARITWFDFTAWGVYTSYYFVTPLVLAGLWLFRPAEFRRYALLLTALAFGSVAIFTVSPTIPPWLASEKEMIGTVTRLIGPISRQVTFVDVSALWERGVRLSNDIAAFPSLHEGMTVLVSAFFWPRVGRTLRALLVLYPLAMAFSLVYLGEHYVTDLVAGALSVGVLLALERRWLRRRAGSRLAPPVEAADPRGADTMAAPASLSCGAATRRSR